MLIIATIGGESSVTLTSVEVVKIDTINPTTIVVMDPIAVYQR